MKVLLTVVVLALSACVSGPSTLSLRTMEVNPPSLMIAKKSHRTLYVVLDPARVPMEVPVLVGGENRGGRLTDGQLFVTRDVVRAMSTYFDEVKVVAPGGLPASGAYAVADVKLERVEVLVTGRRPVSGYAGMVEMHAGAAALTWGFALRLSESTDYLYSFAGECGGQAGEDPTFVFRSMFESSLGDLLKSYTEKKVHQVVLTSEPPAAPAASATSM